MIALEKKPDGLECYIIKVTRQCWCSAFVSCQFLFSKLFCCLTRYDTWQCCIEYWSCWVLILCLKNGKTWTKALTLGWALIWMQRYVSFFQDLNLRWKQLSISESSQLVYLLRWASIYWLEQLKNQSFSTVLFSHPL